MAESREARWRGRALVGLALLGLVGPAGVVYVRAEAAQALQPVRDEVTTLKAQRTADEKRLDEIRSDVKEIRACLIEHRCGP